jgi:MSHA biogenesis protein MshG
VTLFHYTGRSSRGDAVTGTLEADSADALASHLISRGVTPTSVEPAKAQHDPLGELWRNLGGGRPGLNDMILFSRQMYALTKGGLPLMRGIQSLAASTPNDYLRETLSHVIDNLQAGRDLASSLARHPDVFNKFYVSIVRVGESSGTLEIAFKRMFDYLQTEKRIKDKLKKALRYPAMVVGAIAVAIAVITFWVLPKFAPIFDSLGDQLPLATKILLASSEFVTGYWYIVLAMLLTAFAGFRLYVRDPHGLYRWDRFKLRVPVVGEVIKKATIARIARSFALTLDAGVPLVPSLNLLSRAAGNEYLSGEVLALRDGIERGESISRTAQVVDLFTPLALQMISTGEETGSLSEMLTEVAEFYEREVDNDLDNMSAALEPILIVGVGAMVLVLALGVFLPLWDLAASGGGLT